MAHNFEKLAISLGMYEQCLPMMPQNPESLYCDYLGNHMGNLDTDVLLLPFLWAYISKQVFM